MSLAELRERVAKATGADREIDADIALLLAGWTREKRKGDAKAYWREPNKDWRRYDNQCLRYTASLDAAIALVEMKLPALPCADHKKSEIRLQFGDFGCNAIIDRDTFSGNDAYHGNAKTPALALIAALLEALAGSGEK